MAKIISFEELSKIREANPGKTIVQCHGVFDLLHYGHLLHFTSAKRFGDILVVTVTQDRYVNKGPGRPRFSQEKRMSMIAALKIVDYVTLNRFPKGIEPIQALKPHFYVKGPDYREKETDITGGILEEEKAVESVGGKLVFTRDETESATVLINNYFSQWDSEQRAAIENVKSVSSIDNILDLIDSLADLKVFVVGEPIVDTYVFCQAEALSSKSPTVSARFLNQEDYAGGSLAIANHLAALGCQVTLLVTHGEEAYFKELLDQSLNRSIQLESYEIPSLPTPRKTRFLIPFRSQRIFELMNLRADLWLYADPNPFSERIKKLVKGQDLMVVADFGHGMFEGPVLENLKTIPTFIATNVQTNSGNFGFNTFTKHSRYDYLNIDERELRLAMHDRFTPIERLLRKAVDANIQGKTASITLGTQGSTYFDKSHKQYSCPTFFKEVIDTTGAGDAYFTITSLLVKKEVAGPLIPFLGNCYAGLKTRIIGNKSVVSKVDFVRTVKSILQ